MRPRASLPAVNFATDVVEAADPKRLRWSSSPARASGTSGRSVRSPGAPIPPRADDRGGGRGDVVLTLWATGRSGSSRWSPASARARSSLPCTEQLRRQGPALRWRRAPALVVADERNAACCGRLDGPTSARRGARQRRARATRRGRARAGGPVPDHVHERTSGEPERLHGQRYLPASSCRPSSWLDARTGDLVWCTAASGWSKSARNVFIAPWIRGAAALLHDARFDPDERVAILAAERVDVLCMAPTEYRVIVKRTEPAAIQGLRGCVAAGEALNPEVLAAGTSARACGSATATGRRRPGS
jgi:hypothetical protein